jgi:hypothetical protein
MWFEDEIGNYDTMSCTRFCALRHCLSTLLGLEKEPPNIDIKGKKTTIRESSFVVAQLLTK